MFVPLSVYDVTTALLFALKSASSATWGFEFAYGLSLLDMEEIPIRGIVVGGVHLGWLHYTWLEMDELGCIWTVGGFTGHSFCIVFPPTIAR